MERKFRYTVHLSIINPDGVYLDTILGLGKTVAEAIADAMTCEDAEKITRFCTLSVDVYDGPRL